MTNIKITFPDSSIKEYPYSISCIDIVKSIYPSDMSEKDAIILDVRTPSELQIGVVENSTHISLRDLPSSISNLDPSQEYFIYCAGGYRSMIACSILKSEGYKNVFNIYGGFNAIAQNKS